MSFKFSERSLSRLAGVDLYLEEVVHRALSVSTVDFAVTCGLRTAEEQEALFEAGATKVRTSLHQVGAAVDVVAYVDGGYSWEHRHYIPIATAFAWAAVEKGLPLRWGAAWSTPDIRAALADPEGLVKARTQYIAKRQSQGKTPFIDAPHFEAPHLGPQTSRR